MNLFALYTTVSFISITNTLDPFIWDETASRDSPELSVTCGAGHVTVPLSCPSGTTLITLSGHVRTGSSLSAHNDLEAKYILH